MPWRLGHLRSHSRRGSAAPPKLAAVHFRNGEALVVAADEKNEAYRFSCLYGSADTARIA
jgi:hypothetical protein